MSVDVVSRVDEVRLRGDLDALAQIGREENLGLNRTAFSEADMQARQWLGDRLREAGLSTWMDGAGNVFGRLDPPEEDDAEKGAVLIGSHLDSVPGGGTLDGALGVVAGLEVLRCAAEAEIPLKRPLEVVGFADEEGWFGGIFGSRAVCGELSPEDIHQAQDLDGNRLVDVMAAHGMDAMEALHARRTPETIDAYLELHIEQGPVLDQSAVPIGVVDDITGLFKWSARLIGAPDHAGTTPMAMRRDAFLGLAEFAGEIERILEEHGAENSRATVGRIELTPGSANTVPGMVEFSLDVRDTDSDVLAALFEAFRRTLAAIARRRNLMFEFDILSEIRPQPCDRKIADAIDRSAQRLDLKSQRMPSGAAHDCQIMARHWPSGMLFVPSKNGRSHSPAEWTHMEHIIGGTNVLLGAALEMANGD
ncbi:MAG: Zn-dependent hydrolase [Candidatus Competibacterales bacterium]|nr:Zn-dependent hydrolase [Candidatus Competibacterales bacterium]